MGPSSKISSEEATNKHCLNGSKEEAGLFFFLRFYLFIFRERERERE